MKIVTRNSAFAAVAMLVALVTPLAARAADPWDGIVSGKVSLIQVYQNGAFAVSLVGVNQLCPNNNHGIAPPAPGTWGAIYGYAGVGPDGNKAFLATLLAAKASGATVTLYSNSNGNQCMVGALDVF